MDSHNHDLDGLRAQVNSLELQLANAKKQLDVAESQLKHEVHRDPASIHVRIRTPPPTLEALGNWTWPLEAQEYIRYGRQMIMPEVALRGALEEIRCFLPPSHLLNRTAQPQKRVGAHRRSWWIRMPGSSLPGWCRSGHNWSCGRRYHRALQPTSPDSTLYNQARHVKSRQRN